MLAYIVRRLLLMIPTLIGIMVINFTIVQFAPGGPVEQIIAQVTGTDVGATARIGGGLAASGTYKDGTWSVVMTRPLTTQTPDSDLQFEAGRFVPVSFFAWDGSNSETGPHHAMTTWYWLLLKPGATSRPIIFAILAAFLTFAILFWWGRSAARRARPDA